MTLAADIAGGEPYRLGPFLGIPAVLAEFKQQIVHRSTALESSIQFSRMPGCASLTTWVARRSNVDGVHPVEDFGAAELQQPVAQVGGEVLVEVVRSTSLVSPSGSFSPSLHAVQRDDGLANARESARSRPVLEEPAIITNSPSCSGRPGSGPKTSSR